MTFWERYEKLCIENGYKPGSEQAAQALGTNRGTISAWKTSGKPPKTEYLVAVADVYGVSTDYLLGRTNDSTDYTNPELCAGKKKAVASQRATADDVKSEATPMGVTLYLQLDENDKSKAEGFMQGLLSQDKYNVALRKKRA